jgi:hypothetical protein
LRGWDGNIGGLSRHGGPEEGRWGGTGRDRLRLGGNWMKGDGDGDGDEDTERTHQVAPPESPLRASPPAGGERGGSSCGAASRQLRSSRAMNGDDSNAMQTRTATEGGKKRPRQTSAKG